MSVRKPNRPSTAPLINKMDNSCTDSNLSNNTKIELKFDEYTDDKVCVCETASSRGALKEEPCHIENQERSIHNYISIKDKSVGDLTVVVEQTEHMRDYMNHKVCRKEDVNSFQYVKELRDLEKKQEGIHNYRNIKDESIDNLTTLGTELIMDYTDGMVCINETINNEGYTEEKLCDVKNKQECIHNYVNIKDESIDDLTVAAEKTESMADYIDDKVCISETLVSSGCIKQDPCDTEDRSGSVHNYINVKVCGKCGETYDLYCLKCPMLIRIFDRNNLDGRDNTVRWTLPTNFIDIRKTPFGMGIIALRTIPKGVVFGPFRGLESTKDDTVSKWKLKNKELAYTNDPRALNWMRYIRRTYQSTYQNLIPFQCKGEMYYRSNCHINGDNELLVYWNSDGEESRIQDTEDSYLKPLICEKLDDVYACTLCCVGYKSISHLKVHNFTCPEKKNKKDFWKEIVQCHFCKIYLDKKEYSDYHADPCYESNKKCASKTAQRSNCGLPHRYHMTQKPIKCENCGIGFWNTQSLIRHKKEVHPMGDKIYNCCKCKYRTRHQSAFSTHLVRVHNAPKVSASSLYPFTLKGNSNLKQQVSVHNGDRPFACTLCPYKATTKWNLKQHIAAHNGDRSFVCTLCHYKATSKTILKQHMGVHNNDRPFACTLCPYKATRKSILKQHIATHNDDRPFACTLCPYKATTKSILKQHITVHNDNKLFACTLCPHKATTKSNLKQHVAVHYDNRPFPCTLCPYKATRKSILKQHVAVHSTDRPFACTFCSYKTTRSSNLKQHIAVHNDNRPFACTLCPYKATTKSILKQHIAVHNDDKPFACILCPYTGTTKLNLKRHITVHNDSEPFTCTFCPYQTTRKSILKQHMASHNDDRPFACTLCLYKATTKWNLKRHVANHNNV